MEGTRAPYMYSLIQETPDYAFFREQVLASLRDAGDDWHGLQRFRICQYMAEDGDREALRTVVENFHIGPDMGVDMCLSLQRLRGIKGVLHGAEKLGELVLRGVTVFNEELFLSRAADELGEQAVFDALREAGKISPAVEACRLRAMELWAKRDKPSNELQRVVKLTFAELKNSLPSVRLHGFLYWGRRASAADVMCAALELQRVSTVDEQLKWLRVFFRKEYPLGPDRLLEVAVSENEFVARCAARALGNIEHPRVREFAIQSVEQQMTAREHAIEMMIPNSEEGGHELVLRWFEAEQDREVRHAMGSGLRDYWKAHPAPESEVRMLLALYEKGPCGACREFVVRRLMELDALPDALREECADDAYEEVRDLVTGRTDRQDETA